MLTMTMTMNAARLLLLHFWLLAALLLCFLQLGDAFVISPRHSQSYMYCNRINAIPHRALQRTLLFAKQKKGGGGGNNKKKKQSQKQPATSGMEWATSFTLKPFEAQSTRDLVSTAVASFQGRTGSPLCEEIVGVNDVPKALWNAPMACVIVKTIKDNENKENNDNTSILQYANMAALETVGLNAEQWDLLMYNPNPNADHPEPTIKLDLPAQMKDKAYESGYQKKILRKNTKDKDEDKDDDSNNTANPKEHDIGILNAHRWKLEKSVLVDGKFATTTLGIAYAWNEWVLDDSILCAPGGQQREKVDVQDLQKAVDEQASHVRYLKEEQGLQNKDPQVQDAVQELLRLKSLLEAS